MTLPPAETARLPIILAVDDEYSVLSAVARDLRREYGDHYRIQRADSGDQAMDSLRQARLRNDPVALLLVDQRMPGMSGLELLTQAREIYPAAKRVLLTAYADVDASIRAINETRLDYYLMKPWDPPEEKLYPVLTDLLDDWQAGYQAAFTGVTVVGHPFSARSHEVKEFLARNLVPYRALDPEDSSEAVDILRISGVEASELPVVVLPDGTVLERPTPSLIAERIGWKTAPERPSYDLVIVGAGPAGLAAAVYGASEGLSTLLVERHSPGGQAGQSSRIENYLGFPVGLSGGDLARRAVTQARRFGAEILTPLEATTLRREDPYRFVRLSDGTEVGCRALLVSTGVNYRRLDTPGAEHLEGAGVYYGAAVSEALDARGTEVAIVGAGNSAGQAALYLSRFASRVTILVRSGSLASMSHYLAQQIEVEDKIVVRYHATISRLHGEQKLEAIDLRLSDTGESEHVEVSAVFVFIGAAPHTQWLADAVQRDAQGYVLSGRDLEGGVRPAGWGLTREPFWLESSMPGVFVAGDVRHRSVKRVASAVGEGSMAIQFVHQHLMGG